MSAEILGIHGIGQERKSQESLRESWKNAAQEGISASHENAKLRSMDVAFYAPLFRKATGRLGGAGEIFDGIPLSAGERIFLEEILEDGLIIDTGTGDVQTQVLGLTAIPSHISRFLVTVDRKFGRNAGKYLLYILRQVYRYLTDEDLASAIRQKVTESISTSTRLILGHSLGSVVLYDMILRGDLSRGNGSGYQGTSIVTFGSPLTWPTVRRMLGHGLDIQDVGCEWHNLFDPLDAVTGGAELIGPRTINVSVKNGLGDPHAAVNYLRHPAIGNLLRCTT
ncbi:hypothetical protein ACIBEA_34155 [Streptomyces sp. NPDC051555]|uniref:hypothetical protein n=1 Tax=Streptomyces sp. NPDC051555 TaxID=3365657 RepID=UPI0037ABBB41